MKENFTFIHEHNVSVLARYNGLKQHVAIPADACPCPLTVIGRYAFAENRTIKEVSIPIGVEIIKRHAFYNCRSLKKLSIPGTLLQVEDGAFKNCECLSELFFYNAKPGQTCLKHLIYDQNHALEIEVHYMEDSCDQTQARLFFPGFEYEYVANEPARIFSEVGYGAGYLYHQCFFNNDVDYARYDDLFARACVSESAETLERIARLRLSFPYKLSVKAAELYRSYLVEHIKDICKIYFKQNQIDAIETLYALGIFNQADMAGIAEVLRQCGLLNGVAWIMEKNHDDNKDYKQKVSFEL